MYDLKIYFLLFIIYSVIGWIIEVFNFIIEQRKIVNRGFLIGPYCPIYGVGSVLMTLILTPYRDDMFGLFVKAVFICATLEYLTSYIMEKLFKTRWWDYSKQRFNINGRICLETMVLFGIGGCIIIYLVNPILFSLFSFIPSVALNIIVVILLVIFVSDLVISLNIINSFKKVSSNVKKDSTEEISKKVREALKDKSYFSRRLIDAFPGFTVMKKNYEKRKKEIEKRKRKIKRKNKKSKN